MKKYFLTGLAILLPIVITFFILSLVVNIITMPFIDVASYTFDYHDLFNQPFFILSGAAVLLIVSKIFVLIALFTIIIAVGAIGELFLIRWLRYIGDFIIHRIPLINRIYKSIQDIVNTLFARRDKVSGATFSGVVLVPFPHANTYNIGLITNRDKRENDSESFDLTSVFVIGSPNPTMGFMLMYKKDQLIPLNIEVDEAIKFCVSCGVIAPKAMSHGDNREDISAK